MPRKQGEHLNRNEVKTGIVEYILKQTNPIEEPAIRDYIKQKYNVGDDSTIKVHLKDLNDTYKCVGKTQGAPGRANLWDVSTIDHLLKIKEHFPHINLKSFDISIDIIRRQHVSKDFVGIAAMIREYLHLSDSFFSMCLTHDIEGLYNRWLVLYQHTDGYEIYCKFKSGEISTDQYKLLTTGFLLLPNTFRVCVHQDILKGIAEEKALNKLNMDKKLSMLMNNEMKAQTPSTDFKTLIGALVYNAKQTYENE